MTQEIWTVGRLLQWATDYLKRSGSESARLDAQLLLATVTGLDRVGLYVHFDRPMTPAELQAFKALAQRRAKGEPVAYIRGEREFYGRAFNVGPGVLVPRPETELLVEKAVEWARGAGLTAPRLVDVGTGSGIIAITLALELPDAVLVALDVSDEALACAATNAERHGVRDRVKLVRSDLLAKLPGAATVDAVISNPPYLPDTLMATLSRDVRDFEPHVALYGGPDGLDLIRRLMVEAERVLRPGGFFGVELAGTEQGREVVAALAASGAFVEPQLHDDLSRRGRVVTARRAG